MPVTIKQGDMFSEQTDAIVNPVNCVGVMGKGIALEFKERWYGNFKQYATRCAIGEMKPGKMFIYATEGMPKFIINFPTKFHWKYKTKISYIHSGLDDLVKQIKKLEIQSITLPALGCGLGGLSFDEVGPIIIAKLAPLGIDTIVYAPKEKVDV